MSNNEVIDFRAFKEQDQADASFLSLIDQDISSNPTQIKPIPSELMKRMAALIEKAQANTHADFLEG